MDKVRFDRAIARIDQANGEDPEMEEKDDRLFPAAVLYGQRMTIWLQQLEPEASEALQLAVRCQHIQRWKMPRQTYPEGTTGYRQWRTDLAKFHAETAGAILREVGYEEETIGRVQSLVRKERFKIDPEAQALEDIACLVFLDHYFAAFAEKHAEDKLIDIVRKTWTKMSEKGQAAAMGIALPDRLKAIVEKALM